LKQFHFFIDTKLPTISYVDGKRLNQFFIPNMLRKIFFLKYISTSLLFFKFYLLIDKMHVFQITVACATLKENVICLRSIIYCLCPNTQTVIYLFNTMQKVRKWVITDYYKKRKQYPSRRKERKCYMLKVNLEQNDNPCHNITTEDNNFLKDKTRCKLYRKLLHRIVRERGELISRLFWEVFSEQLHVFA
jgi:hypothetical protein